MARYEVKPLDWVLLSNGVWQAQGIMRSYRVAVIIDQWHWGYQMNDESLSSVLWSCSSQEEAHKNCNNDHLMMLDPYLDQDKSVCPG